MCSIYYTITLFTFDVVLVVVVLPVSSFSFLLKKEERMECLPLPTNTTHRGRDVNTKALLSEERKKSISIMRDHGKGGSGTYKKHGFSWAVFCWWFPRVWFMQFSVSCRVLSWWSPWRSHSHMWTKKSMWALPKLCDGCVLFALQCVNSLPPHAKSRAYHYLNIYFESWGFSSFFRASCVIQIYKLAWI